MRFAIDPSQKRRAAARWLLFIFSVEVSGGRSLGRGRGWSGRGGRWGERPPARSPAAGVVEGGGGALGFRVTWVRGAPWPPALEEEGPRAAAARRWRRIDRRRARRRGSAAGRAGPDNRWAGPAAGARRRRRRAAASSVREGGGGGRRRRRRGRRRSLGGGGRRGSGGRSVAATARRELARARNRRPRREHKLPSWRGHVDH